jgi:hypothetical protein
MRIGATDDLLLEFAFVSRLQETPGPRDLALLERQIWEFNTRHRISGTVSHAAGRITQTLQGHPSVILPLAARILSDRRHGDIAITAFRSVESSSFSGWQSSGFGLAIEQADVPDAAVAAVPTAGNVYFLPSAERNRSRQVSPPARRVSHTC